MTLAANLSIHQGHNAGYHYQVMPDTAIYIAGDSRQSFLHLFCQPAIVAMYSFLHPISRRHATDYRCLLGYRIKLLDGLLNL